ncbi:MAG: CPBP family intramembrane metalloprotease [Candidatus Lokiarchaeota archaeon]|nr:CPBP family intramembrane metalloprotease [Candidatus Lokiarchaeota archaeon]
MKNYRDLVLFFVFTYVWSWLCWIIAIIINQPLSIWYVFVLYAFGGIAPSCVGIILSFFENKTKRAEYWLRFTDVKRISFLWFFISLFGPFMIIITAILLDILFFGYSIQFSNIVNLGQDFYGVFSIIGFGLITVLIEEFGWRAYALPKLLDNVNATLSSSILGIFWSFWHIPLFLISGTYQNGLGIFTTNFYIYMISAFLFTFIITFVFQKTKFSMISAMILHFSNNLAGELFGPSTRVEILRVILFLILSIYIIIYWKIKRNKT